MMREEEISRSTHHFTLLKLGNILLKDEFALSFNLGLLPDGMLSEEFVSGSECRVVKHVGVALQHVPNGRTEFRQTSLSLLLLLRPKAVDILRLIQHSSHASCSSQSAPSDIVPGLGETRVQAFMSVYNDLELFESTTPSTGVGLSEQ